MACDSKTSLANRFRGFLPVVIDVETGGFCAQSDALLEVGVALLTMTGEGLLEIEKTLNFHIKPFEGANIESSALAFTGIDPYHPFREAVDEREALTTLFQSVRQSIKRHDCKRAILVGHNAMFDQGFINAAIGRCNIKRNPFHPFSSFDTATLAGLAYGQTVLSKACLAAGIAFDNKSAHSALYDTQCTAELFCRIVNHWKKLGGWQQFGCIDQKDN